jgi:exodeoxyribonuclease VII large subunit
MPASYSLYELNEYIKRVIALNFTEPIWVNCEISQIKEVRGNVYLDLIAHDEATGEITAQIQASIWYKSYLFIKNKLGDLLPAVLSQGSQVLLKVSVDFNERYGLKLVIEDVDPSFTIGHMEMNRQKIIQKLTDDLLIDRNKDTKLPTVIKRLAIISGESAAGYKDFVKHLAENAYGYTYKMDLYEVALQGVNTERNVMWAFSIIMEKVNDYDCVLIIRGGGSKLDLAAFDHYNIGARIGKCPIPVITGIGHDIDSTVADICAYESCKTPTAVADYLIQYNLSFEQKIVDAEYWIGQTARQLVRHAELELNQTIQLLHILPADILRDYHRDLDDVLEHIVDSIHDKITRAKENLGWTDKQMALLDPSMVLKRGYAIIRQKDEIITRAKKIKKSEPIQIEFYDQTITRS